MHAGLYATHVLMMSCEQLARLQNSSMFTNAWTVQLCMANKLCFVPTHRTSVQRASTEEMGRNSSSCQLFGTEPVNLLLLSSPLQPAFKRGIVRERDGASTVHRSG
jgi:hypothetical protein